MSILLNDNLQNNSPKPLDAKYLNGVTPWATVAAANAGIPLTQRSIGLTVNIAGVEYWYKNGITDPDLIVKSGGGLTNPVCTLQLQKVIAPPVNTLGPAINFTHANNSGTIDVITAGITEFFRDPAGGGIYNIAVEGAFNPGISPQNTEWNSVYTDATNNGHANIQNVTTRVYSDFTTALNGTIGAVILSTPLVMHDLITNKYYLFTFTQWTSGGGGGGFAYTRTEVIIGSPTVVCDGRITFDDGTWIDTAPASGGLPIVKYVYLVADATDQTRMGGIVSNVYTTAQNAWDAAVAIIVANPSYKVVIKVGVITAAQAGNIVTNAAGTNASDRITFEGISKAISVLGTFTSTSGSFLYFSLQNVTLGNVTTTGAANLLILNSSNADIGNTSVYYLQVVSTNNIRIGNVALVGGIPTSPSAVQVYGSSYVKIGDITGNNVSLDFGTPVNGFNWNSHFSPMIVTSINITNARNYQMILRGVTVVGNLSITTTSNNGGNTFVMENTKVNGNMTINHIGNLTVDVVFKGCSFENSVFTGSTFPRLMIQDTSFKTITNLPANTNLMNCTLFNPTAAAPTINGIGTNCQMYNTSIFGGSLAIDNGAPVSVKFTTGSSSAQAAMGANITLT